MSLNIEGVEAGAPEDDERAEIVRDIASVLNRHGLEKYSNTPDFILAEHLMLCLEAFNAASFARERWYGKALTIGGVLDVSVAP